MNRTLTATLVAVLSLSPLAAASWGMKGSYEPDTLRDLNDGWMFPAPDTTPTGGDGRSATNPVYMNGFNTWGYATQPFLNPGTASTRVMVQPASYRLAVVWGVWKDCNGDGYVGLGDQGLFEYRSELLLGDTSVCRPGSIPDPIPLGWMPPHNDGEWVHELIPISWRAGNAQQAGDRNAFNVDDNGSRLWADFRLPETDAAPGSCPIQPQPVNSMHSTGGVLWYVDCFDGYLATRTFDGAVGAAGGDDIGLGQVSFKDHERDQWQSASILNRPTGWGEETDPALVQAWDCSQAQPVQVVVPPTDPATEEPTYVVNVSAPNAAPSPDASGSPSGTVNATYSGFDRCDRPTESGKDASFLATLPYFNEGGTIGEAVRRNPDNWFGPFETYRPSPWGAVLGRGAPNDPANVVPGANVLPQSPRAPGQQDPLVTTPGASISADGVWTGQTNWAATAGVDRTRGEVAKVLYWTYYGYVSPEAVTAYKLSLPKGTATGVFGADQCGGTIGPGGAVQNGWDCNPARWFRDSNGVDIEPRSAFMGPGDDGAGVRVGVRVGQPYNLRDVDCYDQSAGPARDAGVHWGALTGTACADTPWSP